MSCSLGTGKYPIIAACQTTSAQPDACWMCTPDASLIEDDGLEQLILPHLEVMFLLLLALLFFGHLGWVFECALGRFRLR